MRNDDRDGNETYGIALFIAAVLLVAATVITFALFGRPERTILARNVVPVAEQDNTTRPIYLPSKMIALPTFREP
jgi:hypothetical protein